MSKLFGDNSPARRHYVWLVTLQKESIRWHLRVVATDFFDAVPKARARLASQWANQGGKIEDVMDQLLRLEIVALIREELYHGQDIHDPQEPGPQVGN